MYKPHLAHSIKSKVSFEPEKGKVSIASLKQVRCHQHPHMHVHRNELGKKKKNIIMVILLQSQIDMQKTC